MLGCGDAAGGSEDDDDDDVVIVGVSTASERLAAAKAAVGSLCIVVFLPAQPQQPIDSRFAAATSCWYSELHHAWLHLYAVAPFRY